ncbi:Protein kinase domain-containing protein [Flavobacterium segetis]|uniref:Protein kinase domain-containing protein n=1 Tax=Flavobacterium segetis TaxID=271157 RepID=A0A1M5EC03_9FLAO|nr:protein kinase family protein [Flavobacterium segetis]SHF76803.1 Protein kinase domain-containing protein [Flavobacterium segetis]
MTNKQDILTSIANLDLFLKVPALKGAIARINKNGNPFVYVGGFNMVFQLTHNSKKWAFRVWHVPMGENEHRYLRISKYLASKKLPYFADFIYDEKGILINGELVDTIRMEWLDGLLFKDYVEKNLTNSSALVLLSDNFLKMCEDLRYNQISHGDLQEGNILVTEKGDIKLVDYDSICIPEIEGQKELVTGLKGYQHPSRFKGGKATLKADYFSELIIYLSILAIAEKAELWNKYQVKDTQYLLFSETDFEDLENSAIYKDLFGLSLKIDKLLDVLIDYVKITFYTDLQPLSYYLQPPVIEKFISDKEVLIQGLEITLSWKVENALKVMINHGVDEVEHNGSVVLKPQDNFEYVLTATGFNETVDKKLEVKVFPTPIIKTLNIPIPIFSHQTSISNLKIETPQINLGINLNPTIFTCNPLDFEKLNSNSKNTFLPNYKTNDSISEVFEKIQERVNKKLKNIFKNE